QGVVVARKTRCVAGRPGQQAQQGQSADGADDQRDTQQHSHDGSWGSASENEKSAQGVASDHELLLSALTWNGRASCEVSRRRRSWPLYGTPQSRSDTSTTC